MSQKLLNCSFLSASLFVHGSFFFSLTGEMFVWMLHLHVEQLLSCGRAHVPLVMPAAARFPRAAAAVLMVEKGKK